MADQTAPRITLHPHTRRVRIFDGDTLIADTRNAIELRERGYPHRPDRHKELPRVGVDMSRLSVSSTVTHCPFKGDTTYYSLPDIADVAWSYERPIDEMKAITGRLAFDAGKVTEMWNEVALRRKSDLSANATGAFKSIYERAVKSLSGIIMKFD